MSTYLLQKARLSEDAITGLLVDLLRAFPEILLDILGTATPSPPSSGPWRLPLFDDLQIDAWPTWASGEPDVLLSFFRGGVGVGRVILEAKLGAGKSGVDEEGVGPLDPTKDQLGKYQREAVHRWPDEPIVVVYLTHHVLAPTADLAASLATMWTPPDRGNAPLLVWCSWQDVHATLQALVQQRQDRAFRAYSGGLVAVLRMAGMFHFDGRWAPEALAVGPPPPSLWWKPPARRYRWTPAGAPGLGLRPPRIVAVPRYRWAPAGTTALPRRPLRLLHMPRYRWTRSAVLPSAAPFYRRTE